MSREPADSDNLPERLAADLGRLYRAEVTPSPAVDQAILNRARAHVAGRKRALLLRRVAGAAAAVILITAAVIPTIQRARHPATPAAVARQMIQDVNADGAVDIRDALALQRSIDAGRAAAAADINGDGAVDQRDVDAVAMLAVRLDARDKGATR
jgi:hypothetical protein